MGKKTKGCTLARQNAWYKVHRDSLEHGQVYEPFWRTDDIPSYGIKSKVPHVRNTKRLMHFLSMNELWMYMHLANNPLVVEVYEQYAIPLEVTLPLADELGVKHPVYVGTRVPIVQTIDFFVTMLDPTSGDEYLAAFPVKQADDALRTRTVEKLALQEGFCLLEDIEYELITSESLRTVHSQNLKTLYRHRALPPYLSRIAKRWLPNFFGVVSDDCHERTAHLIEIASKTTGVDYEIGVRLFYHALWHKLILMNWQKPLQLEKAASVLEVSPNAAA